MTEAAETEKVIWEIAFSVKKRGPGLAGPAGNDGLVNYQNTYNYTYCNILQHHPSYL